ncbi:MAG: hypothetical protein IJ985_01700, partial [Akkermansia sp.]|nr:hypothetical protein [Akkermansia sp.]
ITAIANDGSGVTASCEVTVMPASYVVTYLIDGEVSIEGFSAFSGCRMPMKQEVIAQNSVFAGDKSCHGGRNGGK